MSKKLSKTTEIAYIALMAALIAVCSWISIPTTVPFTMQTFAVFVAVGLLGLRCGTISVLVYLLLGAIGLPVFAGMTGGVGILLGSSGGYLVGFIFIALVEGFAVSKFGRNKIAMLLGMLLGSVLCYFFGTVWFIQVYTAGYGEVPLNTVMWWCVYPFIIPGLIKMALALIVIKRVAPVMKLG